MFFRFRFVRHKQSKAPLAGVDYLPALLPLPSAATEALLPCSGIAQLRPVQGSPSIMVPATITAASPAKIMIFFIGSHPLQGGLVMTGARIEPVFFVSPRGAKGFIEGSWLRAEADQQMCAIGP
jgi:hypothetical protein